MSDKQGNEARLRQEREQLEYLIRRTKVRTDKSNYYDDDVFVAEIARLEGMLVDAQDALTQERLDHVECDTKYLALLEKTEEAYALARKALRSIACQDTPRAGASIAQECLDQLEGKK